MATKLLEAHQIYKQFTKSENWFRRKKVTAVEHLDFAIEEAKTVAVVGETGSGKSTLVKMLVGALEPDQGHFLLKGKPLVESGPDNRYRRIRLIQENPEASFNPRQKIGAQLEAPLKLNTPLAAKARRTKVYSTLKVVGLQPEYAEYYPSMLSGSQILRVALARALILDPWLIVFDETLSGMDVTLRAQMVNLLIKLQQLKGISYVIVAHNLSLIRFLADDVMVMHNGELIEWNTTEALFANPEHKYTERLVFAHSVLTQGNKSAR